MPCSWATRTSTTPWTCRRSLPATAALCTDRLRCCGQVWGIDIEVAGKHFYHQGSANLIDGEISATDVDYFLCGIAGRMYTRDYIERIMRRLRPANVVIHHHDDFFRPLEGDMGFSFNVNLGGFVEDMDDFDPGIALRTLEPMRTVTGAPATSLP